MSIFKKIAGFILFGCLLLIVFIFTFKFEKRMPFVFICSELFLFLVLVLCKSKISKVWKSVIFNFAIAALILGILELYFAKSFEYLKGVNIGTYARSGFFVPDKLFGYSIKKNTRVNSKLIKQQETVYDVIYTINKEGRRISAHDVEEIDCNPGFKNVLFFGCSFTFGEGLNDNRTLPFLFEKMMRGYYKTYNFGVSGYGPQQMLRAIDTGILDMFLANKLTAIVVYQTMAKHVERAAFRYPYILWDVSGPRYMLDKSSGDLMIPVYTNNVASFLLKMLGKSHLLRNVLPLLKGSKRSESDIRLFVQIIKKSKDILENKYNDKLYLIYWDGLDKEDQYIISELKKKNIVVITTSKIFSNYPYSKEKYSIRYDGHPTALANQVIAEYLSKSQFFN